jgi:hypothetical protein
MVTAGTWAAAAGPQFRIAVKGAVAGGAAGDHHLTFSGPIALPNVSLGSGRYIFRRPAANVLQVLSEDGRKPYAMVFTISTLRAEADGYEIRVGPPMAASGPQRLEAWFVPGESTGQQLLYSAP